MTKKISVTTSNKQRRVELGLAITVIIIAGCLRLARLPFLTMWSDEYHSVRVSSLPLTEILTGNYSGEFTPPLYYALLHLQRLVFGSTEIAMRSLSLAFSILSSFLFYNLARSILKDFIPSIAALVLMAFHPILIYYSVEIRSYSQLVFFSLLSFLSCVKILGKSEHSKAWVILLILSLIGCLYTHYFGIIVPFSITVFIAANKFLSKRWDKTNSLILLSVAISGVIFLPGLLILRKQVVSFPIGVNSSLLTESLQVFLFSMDHPQYEQLLAVTAIIAFFTGLMVLITQIKNMPAVLLIVCSIAAAIAFILFTAIAGIGLKNNRYIIEILPLVLIVIAATLVEKKRLLYRVFNSIGVITIILYIIYGTNFVLNTNRENQQAIWKADWKQLSVIVRNLRTSDEPIVIMGWDATPLQYYLEESAISSYELENQIPLHLHPSYLIIMTPNSRTMPILDSAALLYEDQTEGLRILRLSTQSDK